MGDSRARNWGWPRRLAYALGSPLIPVVRLLRIATEIRRTGLGGQSLPRFLPWLIAGLAASSFGEFLGYAGFVGESHARLLEVELYRHRYLSTRDSAGLAHFA